MVLSLVLAAATAVSAAGRRPTSPKEQASRILEATAVRGGLVVHLGCGDGRLTAALRANDSFMVHGLDADPNNVAGAREHIQSLGLYGKSVSVDRLAGKQLPYVDNLVNLIVAEDPAKSGIGMKEVMRVLCPNGVAYVKQAARWTKFVKPRPEEIDEWTHFMHDPSNNAVAQDSVVGPPRHLQWQGGPRWSRMHDHMSSVSAVVSAGGRVFYIFDEGPRAAIELPPNWKLIARDAFNGTILWKRPIAKWHTHLWPLKSGPAHLPRRIVAIGDTLYATLGIDAPVSAINAATGKTIRTYRGTEATEEMIVADGVLFLVVNDNPVKRFQPRAVYEDIGQIKSEAGKRPWSEEPTSVAAVRADTGEILWKKRSVTVPLTLAVDARAVYFHDGEKVVALDRTSGDRLWASAPTARSQRILSHFAPTLVIYKDVVLFAGGEKYVPHRGGQDTMTALSAKTGKTLWSAEHGPTGYQSPEDLLVAGGLVWSGATTNGGYSGVFTGYDPQTGEVKKEFSPDVETYWFHHRCHRGKATEKYLLMSRTGIEFVDIAKESWMIHHWVRGACLYGIMPCNGLIYAPQHPCACYPETKLYGFNALAPAASTRPRPGKVSDEGRLQRGPAYAGVGSRASGDSGADEWPTYRHDATRSGSTKTKCSSDLKPAWEAELGGRLSSPVIAEGKVFLTSVDTHQVLARDADTGGSIWSYTAGGRVDSPPTIYAGRVLFGSADGWVYCLRASDGELAWRFRAAPMDRRLAAFEQVESVWPVHGSVLVTDGVLYCVAGRSVFLDGGLRLLRLDPNTGRKISETIMDDRDPNSGNDLQARTQVLNLPVGLNDILSSDGKHVYMKSQVFDLQGVRGDLGPHSGDPPTQGSVQRGETTHLFCPSGFLDGSWWHRTYWVYGRSFAGGHAGYHQAGRYAPAGRIMVFDDLPSVGHEAAPPNGRVYGFGRKPQFYRWTTPLEYQLFAASKEPPELPFAPESRRGGQNSIIRFEKTQSINPAGTPLAVEAWVKSEAPAGVIVARGGPSQGYALLLRGGRPRFEVRVDKDLFSVAAKRRVVGDWVHLAGVLTPQKKLQIYVNGRLAGTAEAKGLIPSDPAQSLEIGGDDQSSVGDYKTPSTFTGVIDEVRVYHGTLTSAEIEQHVARPGSLAAENAKLVLACSFDKGKATDASGNKNHGKVDGAKPVKGKLGGAMKFTPGKSAGRGGYFVKHDWTGDLPILVRAMVLADKTLFIAGPPDVVDEEEAYRTIGDPETQAKLARQSAALEGKLGAMLLAVSAADGSELARYDLKSIPQWDGMAAAGGRLFFTTVDGKLVCLAGK